MAEVRRPDGRLEMLGKLEVQGYRAGPVDGDQARADRGARGSLVFLNPARHPAPFGLQDPARVREMVAQVSRVVCSNIILAALLRQV